MIPALRKSEYGEVLAVASRNEEKAKAFAEALEIPRAYGSYEQLLADSDIDIVYNPLPNHLHVPYSIRALDAGKHVLCEKPLGLSVYEILRLSAAADRHPRLKVMEAFMYRFHPQWRHVKNMIADGGVGELRTVHSVFSYFNDDAANIRNQPQAGGGSLMDIGCYNISLSRFLFDAEPERVMGLIDVDRRFGTNRLVSGILDFGNATATFTCGTQLVWHQRVQIFGTSGRIEIEIPFNAPADQPTRIWHQRGDHTQEIAFDPCDQYTIQADEFSLAVLNDTPVPAPLTDAINNMKVIEAVLESGRRESWVRME